MIQSLAHMAYASSEEIKQFQQEKGIAQALYAFQNSPYYRQKWLELGIKEGDLTKPGFMAQLPLTSKDDLQRQNDAFFAVPAQKIAEYVTTSGTTGSPVLIGLTSADLERLAFNEALSFANMGMQKGDVVQLTTTLDRRFLAGLAYYLGAQKMGLGTVRVGSGVPELQWDTILRTQPKALVCVPSFLLKMIEYAEQTGLDFKSTSLRKILCIGEPLRNADFSLNPIGSRIHSTYASTEMSTAFTECEAGQGGHLPPELLYAEVLDAQGQPVPEGEIGELVVTPLGIEGMPLIRFQTGDLLAAYYEPCACGRTSMRVGPVVGRKNQMIKYKGTTLYPPALFDLLHDFAEVKTYLIEMSSNALGEDEITVWIGALETHEDLLQKIKERFQARLRVSPHLKFESIENIERRRLPAEARKPYIFIDSRKSK
jgi:phenylacetate-CoA ligase